MRIATANSYQRTIENLQQRQRQLVELQGQLSTGKRVHKASDDPVAATLSEAARNRMARVEADLRALDASRTSLQEAESALATATEIVQEIRTLMISAGNGSYGPGEREDIARQLEGLRERLLGVANLHDNAGRALFGGLGGAATPFVDRHGGAGSGVQFLGQRGQMAAGEAAVPPSLDGHTVWMEVPRGNGQFVVELGAGNAGEVYTDVGQVTDAGAWAVGGRYTVVFSVGGGAGTYTVLDEAGEAVPGLAGLPYEDGKAISFGGITLTVRGEPADGDQLHVAPADEATDLFQVVQNAIDAIRDPTGAVRAHGLAQAMTELDAGLDRLLLARGRAGEWLNRAESLQALLEGRSSDYEIEISRLEDLDLVRGISDFQTQQTGLEAALKAYAQVQQLSLFKLI